jgi:subtilisin family serine protease
VVRLMRRLAAAALLGGAASLPARLQAPGPREVVPNDPWFRNQLSFYFEGGPTSYRVSSTSTERRQISMAPGGTSGASPVVAGVAALMLSVDSTLSAPDLKRMIMETATRLPALNGKVTSGGTVNAYRAVVAARAHRGR